MLRGPHFDDLAVGAPRRSAAAAEGGRVYLFAGRALEPASSDSWSALGRTMDELFGYRDTVLDIEVTPNRPDWLSHIGVAREVAAIFETKVTLPPVIAQQA